MEGIKIKALIIPIFVLLLLSVSVAASLTIQEDEIVLDADYSGFDTKDQDFITVDASVNINNDDAAEAVVTVSVEGLPAGYEAEDVELNIAAGATEKATISVNIPHDKAPGEVKIGTVRVSAGAEEDTVDLLQNTKEMFVFNKIEVDYRDEDDKKQNDEFDTDGEENDFSLNDHVRVGSTITFDITVENLFPDKDYRDSEIEEIEISLDSDDDDIFGDDLDDTYAFSDLEADSKDKLTIEWEIPEDVEAGEYTLEFTLEGEDKAGVKYKVVKSVDLELERQDDDVRITRATVSPNLVEACEGRQYTLDLQLYNYGNDNQDQAAVRISNSELAILENVMEIEMDEFDDGDDTWSDAFTFTLPKGVKVKNYPISIQAFINRDDTIDTETVNLEVVKCPTTAADDEEDNPNVIVSTLPATTQPQQPEKPAATADDSVTGGSVVTSVEDPYTIEDFFIAAVVIAAVLIVTLIALFFMILLKKR
ncbi:hypothetical protein COV20_02190 [Candidatus Woesearchaeota archaeon CG10_big_fil_rev_8_21_14_0_10_45_16]|nr:MAG: hypothetical protein COV20_02190 [Candidatus Woesearchaeota archaeon CG10_big_fil_rev_8_21_14_0_10_45_16]